MAMKHVQATICALAMAALLPATARATDGYFQHGYGMKSKGMGGAATAVAGDTMAAASNPALMVMFGSGLDVGADVFAPRRSAERAGNVYGLNGAVDSDSLYFVMPEFGYNRMIGQGASFGVTLYGNGGMNTDYASGQIPAGYCGPGTPASNLLCGPGRLGVNLSQLVVAPSFAMRLGAHQSLGVAPLIGYQRFEAKGLQAFSGFSMDPASLTDNGADSSIGWGVRIGYAAQVSAIATVGAAYSTKINMGQFKKYRGLFAEQGDFDMPENYSVGLALRPAQGVLVAVDYQRINYSGVKAVGNPSTNQAPLGSNDGPGFGWTDVNVFKLGTELNLAPRFALRAGYDHSDNPVQARDITFNILAPGVIENHVTLGATYRLSTTADLNVAYMHAFDNSVSGAEMMFPGGGTDTVAMYQNTIGVSFTKRLK
jgi:long-chain fatty acid transport protein